MISCATIARRTSRVAAISAAIALSAALSFGQSRPSTPASSELGRMNLSHVAASASQIKAVLVGDPGLMVELKRWVAKAAGDHGEIFGEADLSGDAILAGLATRVHF